MRNGKLVQHRLQHRDQKALADRLGAPHHLPLGHLVDRVDMEDALGPLPVSLVYAVHPQVSRSVSEIFR